MKCSHSHTQTSVSLFWSSPLLVKRDFNQFQDISIWNRIFKIQWDYSASSSSHFSFIFFSFFLVLHIRMGRNCWAGSGLNPERFHICFQLFPHQIFVLKCLNAALKQPVVVYPVNAFAWFSGVEFTRDKVFISPCQPRPWGLRLAGNLVVHCWSVVKGEGGREGFFSWSRTVSRWCHWRETTSWTRNLVRY